MPIISKAFDCSATLRIFENFREFLKNPQSKPSFSPRNFDPQPQKHCPRSHLKIFKPLSPHSHLKI